MNTTFKHDASQDVPGSSRKSATVLSIALSVAASGLVFNQHDDRAAAAEVLTPLSSISDSRPDQSDAQTFGVLHSVEITQAPRPVPAKSVARSSKHIVREGDTLWSISRRYGISAKQLADTNALSTDSVLRIGQALEIPQGASVPAASQETKRVDEPEPQTSRNLAHLQMQTITVPQSPVAEIPLSFNSQFSDVTEEASYVSSQAVVQLRLRREQLQASLSSMRSESLAMPDTFEEAALSQSSQTIARAFSEDSDITDDLLIPSPAPESGASSSAQQVVVYQIERGDTLAAIANEYGVSLQSIINANSISNPNRVFVGQTIRIPGVSSTVSKPEDTDSQDTPVRLLSSTSDGILIGALPQSRFGISNETLSLYSAPVVPLPVVLSEDRSDSIDLDSTNEVAPSVKVDESEPVEVHDLSQEQADSIASASPARVNVDSSSGVYVEELIASIEEISRIEPLAAEEIILDELDRIAQEETVSGYLYRPDQHYIETGDAVNPEFQEVSETIAVPDESGSSASAPDETDRLVAVAPLGSENYSPLSQPVTGRMVSPDLPPLPAMENYIPSGGATFNGYLWPARGTLTSGYGWRWGRMHQGIDIAAPVGTPVYAAAPGVVEFSGWNSGGYGNMVDIRHPDGSKTRYAHNSRNLVRVGQTVTQGQQIAAMGSTGYSTGPHVHFEIHQPERGTVNPVAYLPQR